MQHSIGTREGDQQKWLLPAISFSCSIANKHNMKYEKLMVPLNECNGRRWQACEWSILPGSRGSHSWLHSNPCANVAITHSAYALQWSSVSRTSIRPTIRQARSQFTRAQTLFSPQFGHRCSCSHCTVCMTREWVSVWHLVTTQIACLCSRPHLWLGPGCLCATHTQSAGHILRGLNIIWRAHCTALHCTPSIYICSPGPVMMRLIIESNLVFGTHRICQQPPPRPCGVVCVLITATCSVKLQVKLPSHATAAVRGTQNKLGQHFNYHFSISNWMEHHRHWETDS